MPLELIYFFSHLFNIPQSYSCNHQVNAYDIEDDDDAPALTKRKVMKIKSLYQILYCNLHGGKEKTPLHLFTGHSVYKKCKSREVLTSFNKVGVTVSYNEVQRARNDLARFTYFQRKNEGVPISSHFSKDEFTIGAFDNFDHSNRSSLSGKFSNQVKPEQPSKKPDKTQIGLTKVILKGNLPCQEKHLFFGSKENIKLSSIFK